MKVALIAALLMLSLTYAQAPPLDTLVSPEIHSDRTVTFRIRAPKSSQVTLFGAWMPVGTQEPMTKDAEGVWSITAGPLDPTVYLYTFTVDGVTIADPVNPRVKLRTRTSASILEVPAQPPAVWEIRNVPHGSVEMDWQRSQALNGETRQILTYVPSGYDRNPAARYPVLYLLHGTGDVAGSWIQIGAANFILDSLIAEKKAKPMIIVMPNGHAVPHGDNRAPYQYETNTKLFQEYLLKEVIPWTESKYRVAPGRQNRAIAGLSMGGGQAVTIAFGNPDAFSAIGVFSSTGGQDFGTRFQAALADPKGTNAKLKVFWIGSGDKDPIVSSGRVQAFSDLLNKHQVRHTMRFVEGGAHTWAVWRQCLSEFAPLLF